MTHNLLSLVARRTFGFAAPALVLGMVLVTQAMGITYPSGPAGTLERNIDRLLAKENVDIRLQNSLVHMEDAINAALKGLQKQLNNATDPTRIAFLEGQIAQKQAQLAANNVRLARNT